MAQEAQGAGQHEGGGFAVWLWVPSFHGEGRYGEFVQLLHDFPQLGSKGSCKSPWVCLCAKH